MWASSECSTPADIKAEGVLALRPHGLRTERVGEGKAMSLGLWHGLGQDHGAPWKRQKNGIERRAQEPVHDLPGAGQAPRSEEEMFQANLGESDWGEQDHAPDLAGELKGMGHRHGGSIGVTQQHRPPEAEPKRGLADGSGLPPW